mgnify:FL=1
MAFAPGFNPALYIDEERLARLQQWAAIASHSEAEDDYLRRELNSQLDEMVVRVLDPGLDDALSKVTPATYGIELFPHCAPLREDVVEPWPDVDGVLDNAPRTQDRYFVVPVKNHQEL